MNSSLVSTALRPILGIGRIVTCSRSISANISVIPAVRLAPGSRGLVRQSSSIRSASRALVIHTFLPVTRQPPSTFLANVEMLVVSVPASGSVTANDVCSSPVDDPGQEALLQVLAAVVDDRLEAEDADVHGAAAAHAGAGRGDLLLDDGRLGDAQAAPAVLLGDGQAEPAALGHRVVELPGELVVGCRAPSSTRPGTPCTWCGWRHGCPRGSGPACSRPPSSRSLLRYARRLASAGGDGSPVVGVGGASRRRAGPTLRTFSDGVFGRASTMRRNRGMANAGILPSHHSRTSSGSTGSLTTTTARTSSSPASWSAGMPMTAHSVTAGCWRNGLLDLVGADVLAAPSQGVLVAVDEVEPAVLVAAQRVAGVEPQVAPGLEGLLGHVVVAVAAGPRVHRPDHELADLADRRPRGRSRGRPAGCRTTRRSAVRRRRRAAARRRAT